MFLTFWVILGGPRGRLEERQQFLVGGLQIFRNNPGLTKNSDVVRVGNPAGHNVQVEMPGYTRSGAPTDVETYIEAIGVIGLPQKDFAISGETGHLFDLVQGCFRQGGNVALGNDEEVPRCVGEAIEDDEVVAPPRQEVVFAILVGRKNCTEDTTGWGLGRGDVGEAPRSPKVVHPVFWIRGPGPADIQHASRGAQLLPRGNTGQSARS